MSPVEAAARARHDLGKYIALQARWLPDDAGADALRDALAVDLLRTRDGPDGTADAASVWAACRAPLQASGHPAALAAVAALDAEVSALAALARRLAAADLAELRAGAARARAVGDRLRDLHRQLQREEEE